MQLVAYGAQDIYLTGNPQITFFKVVYRRHTNFSMEAIEQTINGNPTLGGSVECTISRNGDLVGRTYIQLGKGAFKQTVDEDGGDYVGSNWTHALLKQIEVEIGGQLIDRHYGHWLTVYNDLTTRNESAKCFYPDPITGELRNKFKDYAKLDFTNLRRMAVNTGFYSATPVEYKAELGRMSFKDYGIQLGPEIKSSEVVIGNYYVISDIGDVVDTEYEDVHDHALLSDFNDPNEVGDCFYAKSVTTIGDDSSGVRQFYPGGDSTIADVKAGMIMKSSKTGYTKRAWVVNVHNGVNNSEEEIKAGTPAALPTAANAVGTEGAKGAGECVIDYIEDDSGGNDVQPWTDNDEIEFWPNDETNFGANATSATGALAKNKCAFNQHAFNQSLDYWARKPFDYGTEYQLMSGAMGGFRPISKDDYYKITPRINDVWGALPDFPTSRDFPSETCYIPLQFWFCRNPGLALPLIALQYHEVKIKIDFSIRECFSASTDVNWTDNLSSNLKLFCDYIYLDTDERRRFAQVSHEYLIEQLQFEEFHEESTKQTLTLNHPVKEIIWTGKPIHIDYSVDSDGVNEGGRGRGDAGYNEVEKEANSSSQPTVLKNQNYHLQLNGHDRMTARPLDYFTKCQVWQHHTGVGSLIQKNSVAVYSFALKPEDHQPSGTCNFSRIDIAELVCDSIFSCNLYAVNYNVLRIMSGMGGLAYSN